MAEPSALPEPPDAAEFRAREIATRIARQKAEADYAAKIAYDKAHYPAVPSVADLVAAAPTPATKAPVRVASSNPVENYEGVSSDSESIFARPKPAPKKQTGATGPPKPVTPPQPGRFDRNGNWINPTRGSGNSSSIGNPALENLINSARANLQNPDWRERAAAQAESIQNQFHGEPQIVGYHWSAGTGGLQGGNDAGMIAHFSDGTSRWINTSIPGQVPVSRPTTEQVQQSMLDRGTTPGGGGGILPAWNSPTGQNIDLTSFGPKTIDTSLAGPIPPSGWLNSALAAARSGAVTYNTNPGGTPEETKTGGNIPYGGITPSRLGNTLIGTPSGGTIGLPQSVSPDIIREGADTAGAGVRSAMEDRSALYNKITSANISPPVLNQPKHEEWDSSQSGGNYGG